MRIDIITLFPGMYTGVLEDSILARARARGVVDVTLIDLREFTHDRHRTVDDRPYGGGAGMVMRVEPLFEAVEQLATEQTRVVLLTPQGEQFSQSLARRLTREQHLVLICGHYEGVDERVRQALVDWEISIGDYVLTSGNLAAMVVTDAVVRLLPGALGCPESTLTESFGTDRLLDFPQYTRPPEYRGMRVPDILLSGDHQAIDQWRERERTVRTIARRPDLLEKHVEPEQP